MQEPNPELDQLANAVIGAAIEVHRELGPGYLETTYTKTLAIELAIRKIRFQQESEIKLLYKSHSIGQGRLDLLVENQLVVELKAVESLNSVHHAQVIAYLKATGHQLGLLINFNVPLLKEGLRRIILS